MRVLLVSTYELGHQPLHLAAPAGGLRGAGHEVRTLDLAVEDWDDGAAAWAEAAAFSVPMHTAMRLALPVVGRLRTVRPALPVAFYGLYAQVSAAHTAGLADVRFAGEYQAPLLAWVDGLAGPAGPDGLVDPGGAPQAHGERPVNAASGARDGLPALEGYARLALGDERRLAGYVEASRGCRHRCRHCPVPVVYDGRIRVVPVDAVVADVGAQVAAGARHVTFGDPDFLNAPRHALDVIRAVHARFPEVTFDVTAKVDHLLRQAGIWDEMAAAGCLFVVSAFESVDDEVLRRLDKGHTTDMAAAAVALLRRSGIEIRPSLLPFHPWTTLESLVALTDFVADCDLVDNVEPVHYTIRLLLPDGSLLLDDPDVVARLGQYDGERLSWSWTSPDPAVDRLQQDLFALVSDRLGAGDPPRAVFGQVRSAIRQAAGVGPAAVAGPVTAVPAGTSPAARPRLTEPWFCCAEPA